MTLRSEVLPHNNANYRIHKLFFNVYLVTGTKISYKFII